MNRRGFLTSFLKGTATALVMPQIVTTGLNLRRRQSGLYEAGFKFTHYPEIQCHAPIAVAIGNQLIGRINELWRRGFIKL